MNSGMTENCNLTHIPCLSCTQSSAVCLSCRHTERLRLRHVLSLFSQHGAMLRNWTYDQCQIPLWQAHQWLPAPKWRHRPNDRAGLLTRLVAATGSVISSTSTHWGRCGAILCPREIPGSPLRQALIVRTYLTRRIRSKGCSLSPSPTAKELGTVPWALRSSETYPRPRRPHWTPTGCGAVEVVTPPQAWNWLCS